MNQYILCFCLILLFDNAFAQKIFCPLKDATILAHDEFSLESGDPALGVGFKSNNGSVFAIYSGKIISIEENVNHLQIVKVSSKSNFVIYQLLKNVNLNIGSYISAGAFIGLLTKPKREPNFILQVVLFENKKYLSQSKCIKLFSSCLSQ